MAPHDPTWDDTGFGDGEDGFLSPNKADSAKPAATPTPESTPAAGTPPASAATSDAASVPDSDSTDAAARRRVAMPPAPETVPPPPPRRRRAAGWIWGIGGMALLLAGLWFGYDYLTRPTLEEELFTEIATDATEAVVAQQRVDSSFVVRPQSDTAVAPIPAIESSTLPRPERQRQPEPKQPSAAPIPKAPTKPVPPPPAPTAVQKSTKADALYVVQVFSSPSHDDAEEWLGVLRERQIADGYITEQQIKGQTWYRVRFGQFATRAEAEDAAVELGLRQPWIARVR